jgi:DNA polymerase
VQVLTLDFETFWSQTHALTKMSPIEYVMHPETEIISCAIKVDDGPTEVVFGEADIRTRLAQLSIEDKLVVAHNMSMFDSMVLAWRIGLRPRMWGCTLAMARPFHGRTIGLSLATLVRHYGIGVKDNSALVNTKGKHLADFTPAEVEAMRTYNGADTDQCYALFKILRKQTSATEMWTIDSNIRMLVEDVFELNVPLLEEALRRERAKKLKTLVSLAGLLGFQPGVSEEETAQQVKDELMSAPKFSRLLRTLDVEIPVKPSPKDPDKMIPALAKSDAEFTALLEHDNPHVAAATAARLEMKSTLLETRLQSFIDTGAVRGGRLPIPAKYYGAHTGRDSGDLYNALNLPRIGRDKDDRIIPKLTNALRLSLCAPKGKLVIAADLSGIEMRVNHFLWKVGYSMRLWAKDPTADIYKPTAAKYYAIDEKQVDKQQRQFGKVQQLGCGFQCGGAKFKDFAWSQFKMPLTIEVAEDAVRGWRAAHPEIAGRDTGGWARCQRALEYIEAGQEYVIDPWGLTRTCKEGVLLPDGRVVRYPDLRRQVNQRTGYEEWKYGSGRHTAFIYGGKMTENIVQALARIVLMDNVIEFWKRTGLRPALRVYDEAVYVVDESQAQPLLDELLAIMRTPPKWWPELVTWSEGDVAPSYGLAK